MNKEQKINKLTWEFFFEQKFEELTFFMEVICLFSFWLFIGAFIFWIFPVAVLTTFYGSDVVISDNGGFYFILSIFSICMVGVFEWINDNWKKANKRAKRKVNRKC